MAELTARQRRKLPSSAFVFPEERAYPIHDETHARAALARGKANATPEQMKKIMAAVHKRYPKMEMKEY